MFIKIKNKKSILRLDGIKSVNTFYNSDINNHVIQFNYKNDKYCDLTFIKEIDMVNTLEEISKLVDLKVIEI